MRAASSFEIASNSSAQLQLKTATAVTNTIIKCFMSVPAHVARAFQPVTPNHLSNSLPITLIRLRLPYSADSNHGVRNCSTGIC